MRDQGFSYEMELPVRTREADAAEGELLAPRERAEQRGYGIFESDGSLVVDERAQVLSPTEIEAYDVALWGSPELDRGAGGAGGEGCWADAVQEVAQEFSEPLGDVGTVLLDAMAELDRSVVSDGRKIRVDAEWAGCMAASGYVVSAPELAPEYVLRAAMSMQQPMSDDTEGELLRLQEFEREVAISDFECREQVGFEETVRLVRFERESEFVSRYSAEIEVLKERVSGR